VTRGAPANYKSSERETLLLKLSTVLLTVVAGLLCVAVASSGYGNSDAKWGLHFAGSHDPRTNNCSFILTDCSDASLITEVSEGVGRYDVYVIALDVDAIGGTRYGIYCDGSFFFYGWSPCSDLEVPTPSWPDCGEGIVQLWMMERYGPHVTLGVLDIYAYATSRLLGACPDPRVGVGEWCDGSAPTPVCDQTSESSYFGSVGFGIKGYNPCEAGGSGEAVSWGKLKSVYRQ
jgi:hypothetical protein